MSVYIELPKEWAKWSFDVRDIHDNILVAKVTDLDLVRCGECKHKIQALSTEKGATGCELISGTFYEDFFCKAGERRSEC